MGEDSVVQIVILRCGWRLWVKAYLVLHYSTDLALGFLSSVCGELKRCRY